MTSRQSEHPHEMTAAHAVTRYLAETGLSVDAAFQAHRLENAPLGPWALERLTPKERHTLTEIERLFDEARGWVIALAIQGAPIKRPARLPAQEAETLTAALEITALLADKRAVRHDGGGVDVWSSALVISPTLAKFAKRQHALHKKCILSPEALRQRITKHLTRPDGTQAPSPSAWCATNGESLSGFIATLFEAWFASGTRMLEEAQASERRSLVRVGTATLSTFNADKHAVRKATRKNFAEAAEVDSEKRRLFLASGYKDLGVYERLAIVALANLAWDQGLLDAAPTATASRRIVDLDDLKADTDPQYLRFRFPGYAEMARRVGAKPDAEGRIPQHYTRNLERAFQKLSKEARWIPEPVLVKESKTGKLRKDYLVRQALWVEVECLAESGDVLVKLHSAAATSMLASFVDRENLLENYEAARKQIGAVRLRDDFVACEDYLLLLRNANEGKPGGTEAPAENATEADRRVHAVVLKARLWEKMGWDKEAKKRGPGHGQKLEREALAFCKARGILLSYSERPGQKGDPVLEFELQGSRHSDPAQGTLFLPMGTP